MQIPDWRTLTLSDGILPEPMPGSGQLVLWIPEQHTAEFQDWRRVNVVARAEVQLRGGICAVAASASHARQSLVQPGLWDKLRSRLQKTPSDPDWQLPNGAGANQFGSRQTNLLLAWSSQPAVNLEAEQVQATWPDCTRVVTLGQNLFLVEGVETERSTNQPPAAEITPCELAKQWLAQARGTGDRARQATALTDLGVLAMREGDVARATSLLEEALPITRELGLRASEADVLGNLGMTALTARQPERAYEFFQQQLAYAREVQDPLVEKLALDRLAMTYANLGRPQEALQLAAQAILLARAAGDHLHEAELLWYAGIQHADLGQRDAAIAAGQAAIDLMKSMKRPQAEWFADCLRKYQTGEVGAALTTAPAASPSDAWSGSFVASTYTTPTGSAVGQPVQGPGMLRMAISATEAMRKFIASGLKTSPAEVSRQRLETCRTCEHHTGVRCRVCGCFTSAKVKILTEACPLGKWPA